MYILPESMEPETLVQLLSTDYKFAVSFSILGDCFALQTKWHI